jgi:beta-glucanase (GH16 family)
MTVSLQTQLNAEIARAKAAEAALAARITKLETPVVVPPANGFPTTDLPGFKLIFSDDFLTPVAEGQFPAAVAGKWTANPYGWKDTSHNGTYDPSIVSFHDSLMDIFIRTTAGVHRVATPIAEIGGAGIHNQLYGRYAIRCKADSMHGYKGVPLLWPQSETWPRDGEIDFPESNFDGAISAFMHHQGATSGGDQDWFGSSANWQSWHTFVVEWAPTYVTFYLDGTLIGTSTTRIPNTPMRWNLQFETTLDGYVPADSVQGHILIDWVAVWSYAP